jgi:autotransporter passenger strand-loop-strand repeat protein
VASGVTLLVNAGAIVSGATVSNGGALIMSGGTLSGTTIVSSGGDIWNANVASGATLTLMGGAMVVGTPVISAGGTEQIGSGYLLNVSSGQTATGIVVLSGGSEVVSAGGVESGTAISSGGSETVSSGGTARSTVVSSGGSATVLGGGIVSAATIISGGTEFISSGGTVSGATLSGGTLEIASGGTATGSTIGFSAAGGTLILDDSQHFTSAVGVISGFGVPGSLDLSDISYDASNTLGFVEAIGNTSGTLTVSDGTHTATLTLLGQYVAANFTMQSDGHGGTLITDPPVDVSSALSQPH